MQEVYSESTIYVRDVISMASVNWFIIYNYFNSILCSSRICNACWVVTKLYDIIYLPKLCTFPSTNVLVLVLHPYYLINQVVHVMLC